MSRIGRKPIIVSENIQVRQAGDKIFVKGPLGELSIDILSGIKIQIKDKIVSVERSNDQDETRAFHGLTRALLTNAIHGVSEGFTKQLELRGVGYKAEVQQDKVILHVGFSHTVPLPVPEGIKVAVEKNQIIISGIDKQQVGQFAAKIRAIRPPEPYKGKGIRYVDEVVKLKPGKQAAKVGGPA